MIKIETDDNEIEEILMLALTDSFIKGKIDENDFENTTAEIEKMSKGG